MSLFPSYNKIDSPKKNTGEIPEMVHDDLEFRSNVTGGGPRSLNDLIAGKITQSRAMSDNRHHFQYLIDLYEEHVTDSHELSPTTTQILEEEIIELSNDFHPSEWPVNASAVPELNEILQELNAEGSPKVS